MNIFAVVFLCFQACLVQNVFSQCQGSAYGAYGPATFGAGAYGPATIATGYNPGLATGAYAPTAYGYPGYANAYSGTYGTGIAAYGGAGEGNVAVAGELPVAGTTTLAGQVPIMGAVRYEGPVAAGGAVSIAGNCACGCGSPYGY